ncbi:MAG: hypothetical protein K2O17_06035 [Bacteroidaceae bacterium]|nr:hypothetical protein [Bacteroidaceae bacterium]
MKKVFAIATIMLVLPLMMWGQATKPTLMVVPSDTWCSANGYVTTFEDQGRKKQIPDYERAILDMDLDMVITKIGELMTEQGFSLDLLSEAINGMNNSSVRDEMITSRTSGSGLAENSLDRTLNYAKADILVEVAWKVNTNGPKRSITYMLRAKDAYTRKQVATAQGTGAPSFSAELPVLLEEAVVEKMDGFVSQLQSHFDDLLENGREVSIDIRVFDNGSGLSLEEEYGGEELINVIEKWMAKNTVNHRYNLSNATDMIMRFGKVRIPLYTSDGSPMTTRLFVDELRNYLKAAPYSITTKAVTYGLGHVELILGEK